MQIYDKSTLRPFSSAIITTIIMQIRRDEARTVPSSSGDKFGKKVKTLREVGGSKAAVKTAVMARKGGSQTGESKKSKERGRERDRRD